MQKQLTYASDDQFMSQEDGVKFALEPSKGMPAYTKSEKFQWLPSEFCVDASGSVKISSYINNLHPEHHAPLYDCIEKIFEKFLPMFNKVLTGQRNPMKNRIEIDYYSTFEYEKRDVEGDSDDDDANEYVFKRKPIPIPKFETPPAPANIVNLNGRNLQVIVKLANIYLTPEQPDYPGDDDFVFLKSFLLNSRLN